MDPEQRFDACMQLADFASLRHDRRREYEWKVTLGLWAVILASVISWKGHRLPWWLGSIVVLGYAFGWLRGVWVSNEKDGNLSRYYRGESQEILHDPNHTVGTINPEISSREPRFWLGFLHHSSGWSQQFQLVATAILVFAACLFGGQTVPEKGTIEAEQFIIRDPMGKVRGRLGLLQSDVTGLELYGDDGRAAAILKVTPDQIPALFLKDEKTSGAVKIAVYPGAPSVELESRGIPRVFLSAVPDPLLSLNGEDGKSRAKLWVTRNDPGLRLTGLNGKVIWSAP